MFTPISIIFTRIVYAYLHLFIIYAYYILFMMCSRSSQNFKPARTWPPVLKGHKKTYFYISQSLAMSCFYIMYIASFFFFGGGPIARSSCVLLLFFLFEEYGTFIRVYHLPRWGGAGNYPLIHRFMNVARAPLHSNHMNGDQRKSHDTVTTAKNKLQEKLTIWHANPRLLDVEIFLNMVRFATALMWWR